jgi:coenzyme F420-reducing hydrogenase alpha subunit
MVVLTFPLSRIEGHARIVMLIEQGELKDAGFQATEFRGFYNFLRGQKAHHIFQPISRVCGVCTTAHSIASIKTLEDIYQVQIPEIAMKIRNLMLLGQIIQSHATSLFIFTMPDLLSPGQATSIFNTGIRTPSFPQKVLEVRRAGTRLMVGAGGQVITPLNLAIGGVDRGISIKKAKILRNQIQEALNISIELLDTYWEAYQQFEIQFQTQSPPQPSYYITATDPNNLPVCPSNSIRVMNSYGDPEKCLPYNEYVNLVQREPSPISFADRFRYKNQMVRVGSLARLNMIQDLSPKTPLASAYFDQFRKLYDFPSHDIFQYELARSIELVLAMEQALNILESPLDGATNEILNPCHPQDGEGYGVVEAPRGVLIHHYIIKNGRLEDMELLIPTMYNILAMEESLKSIGSNYITPNGINIGLEDAVGRIVRAFDPCLACATH